MNTTKSFKDFLLEKDLCVEKKNQKAFKVEKAIKALTKV
jgi:hypothetical protein